jgi:hypothetical protein
LKIILKKSITPRRREKAHAEARRTQRAMCNQEAVRFLLAFLGKNQDEDAQFD